MALNPRGSYLLSAPPSGIYDRVITTLHSNHALPGAIRYQPPFTTKNPLKDSGVLVQDHTSHQVVREKAGYVHICLNSFETGPVRLLQRGVPGKLRAFQQLFFMLKLAGMKTVKGLEMAVVRAGYPPQTSSRPMPRIPTTSTGPGKPGSSRRDVRQNSAAYTPTSTLVLT